MSSQCLPRILRPFHIAERHETGVFVFVFSGTPVRIRTLAVHWSQPSTLPRAIVGTAVEEDTTPCPACHFSKTRYVPGPSANPDQAARLWSGRDVYVRSRATPAGHLLIPAYVVRPRLLWTKHTSPACDAPSRRGPILTVMCLQSELSPLEPLE